MSLQGYSAHRLQHIVHTYKHIYCTMKPLTSPAYLLPALLPSPSVGRIDTAPAVVPLLCVPSDRPLRKGSTRGTVCRYRSPTLGPCELDQQWQALGPARQEPKGCSARRPKAQMSFQGDAQVPASRQLNQQAFNAC